MHLSVDFYSKNEISVDHNFTDFYGGYSEQFRNLLLLSTYLTRQYQNIGTHPIGIILSDLLKDFTNDAFSFLLDTEDYKYSVFTGKQEFLLKDNLYSVFEADSIISEAFTPVPSLVESRRSKAKKYFHLSLSPCILKIKGFTVFTLDFSFYVYHSVFAAINSLGRVFHSDQKYIYHLLGVIDSISRSYRTGEVYTPQNAELFSLSVLRRITGE